MHLNNESTSTLQVVADDLSVYSLPNIFHRGIWTFVDWWNIEEAVLDDEQKKNEFEA